MAIALQDFTISMDPPSLLVYRNKIILCNSLLAVVFEFGNKYKRSPNYLTAIVGRKHSFENRATFGSVLGFVFARKLKHGHVRDDVGKVFRTISINNIKGSHSDCSVAIDLNEVWKLNYELGMNL